MLCMIQFYKEYNKGLTAQKNYSPSIAQSVISQLDDNLCRQGDEKTIGLLLCRTKDRIKAEYALRDIQKPIGISDYELGQALPMDFRGSLPTIEEIENELGEEI